MTVRFSKPKWEFSCWVSGAPTCYADGPFTPFKIALTNYEDRSRVVVSGRKMHGNQSGRSLTFYLGGYQQFKEPPEWVLEVLREAAFQRSEIA